MQVSDEEFSRGEAEQRQDGLGKKERKREREIETKG
jgi:hypothetical protein